MLECFLPFCVFVQVANKETALVCVSVYSVQFGNNSHILEAVLIHSMHCQTSGRSSTGSRYFTDSLPSSQPIVLFSCRLHYPVSLFQTICLAVTVPECKYARISLKPLLYKAELYCSYTKKHLHNHDTY